MKVKDNYALTSGKSRKKTLKENLRKMQEQQWAKCFWLGIQRLMFKWFEWIGTSALNHVRE